MTKRNLRYAGLGLGVLAVSAMAACGSDDNTTTPPVATAGAKATAGASPGGGTSVAGTPGVAGGTSVAGTGTGGGATGGAPGTGYACAGVKPASSLITEFADLTANPTMAGDY